MSTAGGLYLPSVDFGDATGPTITPRETYDKVATPNSEAQATSIGLGSVIRVMLGEHRVGADELDFGVHAGRLIVIALWPRCSAPVQLHADDQELPIAFGATTTADATCGVYSGTRITSYDGSQTTPDPTLQAWYGVDYQDTYPGIPYSVVTFPQTVPNKPSLYLRALGVTAYDPRDPTQSLTDPSTWKFTRNPTLLAAAHESSTVWGCGKTVNWATVATCANLNDTLVGDKPRRQIGLTLDCERDATEWRDALAGYAACYINDDGSEVRFVPDGPTAAVKAIGRGQVFAESDLELPDVGNVPTVVAICYTNTSKAPWFDDWAYAYRPGVLTGDLPMRLASIEMRGIQDYAQALREAEETLNKATLTTWTKELAMRGEAEDLERGDVLSVTDAIGLSNTPARVRGKVLTGPGEWRLLVAKHDDAMYSDTVADGPSVPDTTLPLPTNPPGVAGIAVVEELYTNSEGAGASRLRVSVTPADWPWPLRLVVALYSNNALLATATVDGAEWPSPAVQDNITYQVRARWVTLQGTQGAESAADITAAGSQLRPTVSPGWVQAFEAGGALYLVWLDAISIGPRRYELRYGPTTGSWETATLIDRIDALSKVVAGLPQGTWRIYVKTIAGNGLESLTALTRDIAVTLDAAAFQVNTYSYTAATLTNMTAVRPYPQDPPRWVTDLGDGIGYGHADTNNATGVFTDLQATAFPVQHTAGTSRLVTEWWDAGLALTGQWTATATVTDLAGTAVVYVELSSDGGSTYQSYQGGSAKGTGRQARLRIETTGAMIIGPALSITLNAVPREEVFTVTTAASGPTTITLANKYAKAKTIQITPQGTAARTATYDNVQLSQTVVNTFDVYCFNASGGQVACTAAVKFEGF